MKFFTVLIFAVLKAGITGATFESCKDSLMEICMTEHGTDMDTMYEGADEGNISDIFGQVLECVLTKAKWLNPDGTFNFDKYDELLNKYKSECKTSEEACLEYEAFEILKNCTQTVKPDTSEKYGIGKSIAKCFNDYIAEAVKDVFD